MRRARSLVKRIGKIVSVADIDGARRRYVNAELPCATGERKTNRIHQALNSQQSARQINAWFAWSRRCSNADVVRERRKYATERAC